MSGERHGLRRRLVAAFALFSLVTALCFSAFCLLFVYVVEDGFFDRMLAQEAAHQRSTWQRTGALARPLRPFVTIHRSRASFPADLARRTSGGAPGTEFAGEAGRHYHLRPVALAGGSPVILVAEVSAELAVRPRLPFILAFLGLSTLVLLVLTIGVGYVLAVRATRPLSDLSELLAGAEPGRLPRGFSDAFPDNEIGLLARSLDAAMARIAGFIAREQHFTRDASHELRTPLTVIDGAAQLLARQQLDPKAAAQVMRIASACAHMAHTIDALLALAREELAPSPPQPVALLPIIERAVVDHASLLDGKAVEVTVEVSASVRVLAHGGVLAILVSNLVSNAFAHTRQGLVRITMEDGALVVADSGPGMPPGLRVFDAGVKGDSSAGHGLGLSIASRLAARSGIALLVESSPQGSRVALHWGLAQA